MNLLDRFSVNPEVHKALQREANELRADKQRLLAETQELKAALAKERDENTRLIGELQKARVPKIVTDAEIARRLHIPVAMLDQIDLDALGVEVDERRH